MRKIVVGGIIWAMAALIGGGLSGALQAAQSSGEEVVVVYNSRMKASRELAQYYATKRGVPANQVIGLALPEKEEISRLEFRDDLQKPLAAALAKKKLWRLASEKAFVSTNESPRLMWRPVESKIRYAVLCFGIPLKIAKEPNFSEDGMDKVRPEFRRDEASVDSELALLPLLENRPPRAGPTRNPAFGTTNSAHLNPTNGVLMVARLDGPTPAIAKGLIDKALQAEQNGLWGRGYFDIRNTTDTAYKSGDDWIKGAAEFWRYLGFEGSVDTNSATMPSDTVVSQVAYYAGWYVQDADGPWARDQVEFVPGAFAYHLHSFSASTLRSDQKAWVGPLLARGATISMGSVYEPYLGGTPDLTVFTSRLIFNGFSFGEAAYASQSVLSWQTTVVGDPLYRPFGKEAEALHRSLEAKQSPLVDWSYLRLANLNLVAGRPMTDVATFIESLPRLNESAVLTEKLADLYSAIGKPSSMLTTYERALERGPSPMQRLRLKLTLAEKLEQEDPKKSISLLEEVLKENSDYPALSVYRKLLPLARKSGDDAKADAYQARIRQLEPPPAPAGTNANASTQASQ